MASLKLDSFAMLLSACQHLASEYRTICPTVEDGVEHYRLLEQMTPAQEAAVEGIALANKAPLGSIKSFLFPDTEVYIKFSRQGNQVTVEDLEPLIPQVIIGAKACDLAALELMDKVFLAEPVDTMYRDKRNATTLIANLCATLGRNCSCDNFGVLRDAPGADLLLACDEDDGSLYLRIDSPKGKVLAKKLLDLGGFTETDYFPQLVKQTEIASLEPAVTQQQIDALFDSPLWEKLSMRCIGCATCTYYCPTCHCYDIKDFQRNDQGVRYRTWDSCMFSNFTVMAGGHNPRPEKIDRLKNRFFHKLSYFVKKQGRLACVGCGRCAVSCPVGISIDTVLREIVRDKDGQ